MDISEEDVSLAKRILRDLKIIFDREPNLLEFDIIPVEEKVFNKSPVIVENHRLGLESWSIKHLYTYTYHQFMESRCHHHSDKSSLHEWTRLLLLINPDLSTAWNCRKQLVLDKFISIHDELKFSELLLKRRNKCPDNFAHRQWLLRLLQKIHSTLDENLVNNELELCYEAANRYQSNYYAWNHRRWIIENFANCIEICLCELSSSKSWIERHISDYSGFSYRQYLFLTIADLLKRPVNCTVNRNDVKYMSLLVDEMNLIDDLLQVHCDRESLYLHRRFVLTQMILSNGDLEKDLLSKEKDFIIHRSSESGKNISFLLERHKKWCSRTLKWDLNSLQ